MITPHIPDVMQEVSTLSSLHNEESLLIEAHDAVKRVRKSTKRPSDALTKSSPDLISKLFSDALNKTPPLVMLSVVSTPLL